MTSRSSSEAYTKAILHCLKYPTQPVSGLLVGKRIGSGASTSIFVADAVPVTHTQIATSPSPVLEIVLLQVLAVARTKGQSVVGVYVANEIADDVSISDHTLRVLRHVAEKAGSPPIALWMIRGTDVDSQTDVAVSQTVYPTPNPGLSNGDSVPLKFARWNSDTCSTVDIATTAALAQVVAATDSTLFAKLNDFEDHLENVAKDYFNETLLQGL